MSVTHNQAASSINKGEEDTLQRLLRAVALLQARIQQRQQEANKRHRQTEERHTEAMKVVEQREDELRWQIATMKATTEKPRGTMTKTTIVQALWTTV
ncbi:hypothetical protein CR513_37951, partial [Mucuna pruriens]